VAIALSANRKDAAAACKRLQKAHSTRERVIGGIMIRVAILPVAATAT